ncbi:MAG: leucine-rich repeat protein [Clostridia bacterium]|nr:leucine-rich repeat protein [Clostridia bacterium]
MKKLLTILLSLMLIATLLPATSVAVGEVQAANSGAVTIDANDEPPLEPLSFEGDYEYSVSYGEATITGYTGAGGDIVIPSTLGGHRVTGIGDSAFEYCKTLTSVVFPETIESIGDLAFGWCESLESIDFPDSLTEIGASAFTFNGSLTEIVIPGSVTSIGKSAFDSCASLSRLTIENGVTSIGDEAFYTCSSLTEIVIPDSVTEIGRSAFFATGWYDNHPIGLLYLNNCLLGCKGVPPSGDIAIEEGTRLIAGYAFDEWTALTSIAVPASVKSISEYALFGKLPALTHIDVSESNPYYKDIDGVLFSQDGATLLAYPEGKPETSYAIPDTVIRIGAGAFSFDYELASVTLPDSLKSIGAYAFNCCYALKELALPDGLTLIGEAAFSQCDSLAAVNIPNTVERIGTGAFAFNYALTEIAIPGSVASIADSAFYDCKALSAVTLENGVTSIGKSAFYMCESLTSIVLPDSVTNIDEGAFHMCESLTSITIPNSVARIDRFAFLDTGWYNDQPAGLLYLDNCLIGHKGDLPGGALIIEEGTRLIADYAFHSSELITSLSIPASVERIGNHSFSSCKALTSVTIPNSVVSIGESAFEYCELLTSISISSSVRSIGNAAFRGCFSLTSINLPASVVSIGDYAFFDCYGLNSITLPNSVRSIGDSAFYWCAALTSITIPGSVTSIGSHAFFGCDALNAVTFEGAPPSEFGSRAFYDEDGSPLNVTLYYYDEYAHLWAPNGETTWEGYKLSELLMDYFVVVNPDGSISRQYAEIDEDNCIITNLPPNTTAEQLATKLGADVGSLSGKLKTGDKVTVNDTEYTVIVMGDVDSNGDVNAMDAASVLRAIVRLITLNSEQAQAANTSFSNTYSAADAASILRFIVRLEATLGKVE